MSTRITNLIVNLLARRTEFAKTVKSPIVLVKILHKNPKHISAYESQKQYKFYKLIGISVGFAATYFFYKDKVESQAAVAQNTIHPAKSGKGAEEVIDGLPTYDYEEISKHSAENKRIWVTYKHGVYDITSFVSVHPGGKQILEAAGGSIDPFWDLYQQHNNEEVLNILASLRIGNYKDGSIGEKNDNLWDNQPKRDPHLIVRSERPFNAETPKDLLGQSYITPNHLFYVRHHLPVPEVDIENYKISIKSNNKKEITLTLDELKKFSKHNVTASLMCAGNRRSQMNKFKQTRGLEWGPGAIGNAQWSGARLKDVLESMGVKSDEYLHVQFTGLDLDAVGNPYGASIPLATAMNERNDVILAYEMNGYPIPKDHGYPVRAFIPGTVGARCVKWLSSITISDSESPSHWQQQDYKGFHPNVDPTAEDYKKSTSIQYLPVNSAVLYPEDGGETSAKNGFIEVRGYAWAGGGQKIVRVDITTDQGKNWTSAEITDQDKMPAGRHWAWTLWKVNVPVNKGQKDMEVWVKAIDSNYNNQPDNVENIWNIRGVLNNSFDKINFRIK